MVNENAVVRTHTHRDYAIQFGAVYERSRHLLVKFGGNADRAVAGTAIAKIHGTPVTVKQRTLRSNGLKRKRC